MSVYSRRKLKSQVRGFTLIELLIVIAIIAILVSILIPALGKVKQQALSVVCASGMRQIAIAFNNYGMDNNDKIPVAGKIMTNTSGYKPWIWSLLPYIDGDTKKERTFEEPADLWFCPADKDPYPLGYAPHGQRYTSYALNGLYQKATGSTGWTQGNPELRFGPGGKCRFDKITQPSDCMLMMETSYYGQVYDMTNPNLSRYRPDWQGHHRFTSGFYHNEGMNIMYVDTHVSSIKGRQADEVVVPATIASGGYMFWPDLALPDSQENPILWGPAY